MSSNLSTAPQIVEAWHVRQAQWEQLRVQVDGPAICREIIGDLEAMQRQRATETLSPDEAAKETGYSVDHLLRLKRQGKLPNAGTEHRPRFRRADLPRKPQSTTSPSLSLTETTRDHIVSRIDSAAAKRHR